MRGIETVERGVDVAGLHQRLEYGGRIGLVLGILHLRVDAVRRDAAGLQMARESEHRDGQPDVAIGERLGGAEACEIRHRIVGGDEALGGGSLQPRDHGLRACGEAAVMDPQRGVVALSVEGLHRPALGDALAAPVEMVGGDDGAQPIGDLGVAGGEEFVDGALDVEAAAGGARRGRRRRFGRRLGGARGLMRRFGLRRLVLRRRGRRQRRWRALADDALAIERRRRRQRRFDARPRVGERRRGDDQRQRAAGNEAVESITHERELHPRDLHICMAPACAHPSHRRRRRLRGHYAMREPRARTKSYVRRRLPSIRANAAAN